MPCSKNPNENKGLISMMRYTVSKIAQSACNVTVQNMYQAVTLQFNRIIAKNLNLLRSLVTFLHTKPKLPQF